MAVTDQHYVQQPAFLFFIRIAQAVLSLIILGLAAYGVATLVDYGGSFGFNIFCALYTWIVVGYLLGTSAFAIGLWNCWAALVLEIFGVIFWLCAWGSMAAWAAVWNWAGGYGGSSYGGSSYYGYINDILYKRDLVKRVTYKEQKTAWQCVAAASGLGALVWILFLVTLITYSIHLHRHRKNPENANLPNNGEPVHVEKHEMQPQGGMQYPQQGYTP